MPLRTNVDHVAGLMHTLATQDVIPNTFGMISSVHRGLEQIRTDLARPDAASADPGVVSKLRQLLDRVENGRLLFAIPETWLINNVMAAAAGVRKRADELFGETRS